MSLNKTILNAFLLCILSVAASAQTGSRPPAYPWHCADIWWTATAKTAEFYELSIDFRVVGNVPDTVDLYIAPFGLGEIGETSLYGGVQTNAGGWPTKTDQRIEGIGRGGIFSRWSADKRKIPVDFADGPPGAHFESADYEDNFVSVRRRVAWNAGSYTYIIRRARFMPTDNKFAWFTAYVRDNSSGVETEIGSLRIDGPNYALSRDLAAFVEVYGSTSIIPVVTVIFGEPRVNGVYRPNTSARVLFPANDTKNKPRFATASRQNREITITLRPEGVNDKVSEQAL